MIGQPQSAGEILVAGSCTAPCLLARDTTGDASRCTCCCGGKFHGALAGMLMPADHGEPER
jgi:hypothetical protein